MKMSILSIHSAFVCSYNYKDFNNFQFQIYNIAVIANSSRLSCEFDPYNMIKSF